MCDARCRVPPADTDDAVDHLVEQTADLGDEIAIFGHSLGAYLGLCLAARLERRNSSPRCTTLFASANAGPASALLPMECSPLDATDDEIIDIAELPGGEFDATVMGHPQLGGRTAALLRADFALSHGFLSVGRHTVTEADIVVCCGRDDVLTDDRLASWTANSTGATSFHRFDGGHFYLRGAAGELAAVMDAAVRRVPSRP